MERDGWRCQAVGCRSPEHTVLHVHHKRYLSQREPWEYPLDNLITYCEKCHDGHHAESSRRRTLVEGEFYRWSDLPDLLGFEPHGYLTQDAAGVVRCGCFRLDYNPDAPDIVLPGTEPFIADQARVFARQRECVPVFVKAEDFGWEYCGEYHVKEVVTNSVEIETHAKRAERDDPIAMLLLLEKGTWIRHPVGLNGRVYCTDCAYPLIKKGIPHERMETPSKGTLCHSCKRKVS